MNKKCVVFTFMVTFFVSGVLSAQKSYNALMFEGNRLFEKNNYDAAAGKYMEAAKVNYKNYDAHYNLGNALYKKNNFEEAKAEYEKANQLAKTISDKASALHNLGNAYMKLNQPEKAAEFYKQSLKQNPHNEKTRKNYEIAKLKEKENQQKEDQKSGKDKEGGDDQKQGNQGQGNQKQQNNQGGGQSQQNQGQGNNGKEKNENNLPKGMQDAILNRASEKERETARRILNKNSYSMPESNEKDW